MLALALALTAVAVAAPTLSIVSGPAGPTNDTTPAFEFDVDAGATVECSIDQGTPAYGSCSGGGEHTVGPGSPLADGAYTFRVRATDSISEQSVATRAFAVDTVAPTATIGSGPAAVGSDASPTFTFSSNEGAVDFECSLDGVGFADCNSPKSYGTLVEGAHSFAVRAIDAAGNVGPEDARSFTIDVTAPTLTILSGPGEPTNDDTPEFAFQAEAGAAVECSVDQGSASWGPCSGAATHIPPTLADDTYVFRVRATDTAGNTTARTRTFAVDTVAPGSTIDSAALGTTDDQTPTFQFSSNEGGVTFQCRFDSPAFSDCSSPKSYGPLASGSHSFAVRAIDAAGNIGVETLESFTIDLTNPTLAIVSGPAGATNDDDPEFEFQAEDDTAVECSIDQGTPSWGPCDDEDSHAAPAPLADGAYVFRVKATDDVPHQTIETRGFTVDTVVPETAIASGPSGPSNSASPSFAFAASEPGVSFECLRDGEDFAPCTSPKAYAGLPDGPHSFRVRAIDAAGNVGPPVPLRSFSIDTVAPTVAIGFGPSGTTSDDSPLFEFSVAGASTVECSIDQGTPSYGPCSSAGSHVVIQRLPSGTYVFRVRVSDPAGNTVTATRSFTVAMTGGEPPAIPLSPPATAAGQRLLSPFPLVRLSGRLTRLGAKVQTLSVRAPQGSLVRVRISPRCAKGARCPVKRASGKVGKKGILRFKQLELGFRAGTAIEIRVSRPGLIGKYTRFVIRRGKGPQRLDRCLMPDTTRPSQCPAS